MDMANYTLDFSIKQCNVIAEMKKRMQEKYFLWDSLWRVTGTKLENTHSSSVAGNILMSLMAKLHSSMKKSRFHLILQRKIASHQQWLLWPLPLCVCSQGIRNVVYLLSNDEERPWLTHTCLHLCSTLSVKIKIQCTKYLEEARDAKHHQIELLNSIGFANSYKITILVINLQHSEGKEQVNGIGWQRKQMEVKRDRKKRQARN